MPQWKSPMGAWKRRAADEAEHRVAEIAVQERHGLGADAAAKAIAHHEVGAVAKLGEEARDVRELVAVVGVGHEDVLAARGANAGVEGSAVAADGDGHDARAVVYRDLLRAVG